MDFITIINAMREYQKMNHIKRQCLTNTQYLYDCFVMNGHNQFKPKSVIVIADDIEHNRYIFVTHMVLINDENDIIDSSYEVYSMINKKYCDNINDAIPYLNQAPPNLKKKVIQDYLQMIPIEKQMMNGKLCIADRKYYDQQADYVESIVKKFEKTKK